MFLFSPLPEHWPTSSTAAAFLSWCRCAGVAVAALFAIFRMAGVGHTDWLLTFIFLSGSRRFWRCRRGRLCAAARTKEELRSASRPQRRGFKYQPCHRSGVGRLGLAHWDGCALLDQCLEHVRRHRRAIWWRLPTDRAISAQPAFINAIRAVCATLAIIRSARDLDPVPPASFRSRASIGRFCRFLVHARIAGGPETYAYSSAQSAPALFAARRIAGSGKAGCRSGHDRGDGRTALALVLFAIAREPATGLIACVLAGISWLPRSPP